jgi:hypothetical protein
VICCRIIFRSNSALIDSLTHRLYSSFALGAIPLSLVCIIIRVSVDKLSAQFTGLLFVEWVLEVLTLGPWNPAMFWWTSNVPLWFMNTLLWYYYLSWWFIRWIRSFETVKSLILLLLGLVAIRLVSGVVVLVSLMYIYPETYVQYGFVIHCWTVVQIYLPFMGATLSEIAARVGPLKHFNKTQVWILTDICSLIVVSLAFFIPPFSSNERVSFMFANLCDYGDLLVTPFLIFGLYLHSHDFSTLSYIYSKFPRFWADLVRLSFPAFLFHWPIMICLIIFSRSSLQFDKPMDEVYICGTTVLLCAFVDSYIVLALEDRFIDFVKPRLVDIMKRLNPAVDAVPISK